MGITGRILIIINPYKIGLSSTIQYHADLFLCITAFAPFASHQVTTHNQGCGSKLSLLVCFLFIPASTAPIEQWKNPGWLGYIDQLYRDYNKGVLVCVFNDVFLFWGVFRLSTSNHCNSTGRNKPWKGAGWGHFCDSAITVKWQWLNRANFKALV